VYVGDSRVVVQLARSVWLGYPGAGACWVASRQGCWLMYCVSICRKQLQVCDASIRCAEYLNLEAAVKVVSRRMPVIYAAGREAHIVILLLSEYTGSPGHTKPPLACWL
jgi:hypothetical protein